MNGLICYRIAGGELTDIVASYDGFITIEPENYRNHTTKITITDKFTINKPDVLNVAIQITTNGKSVLHKSTRIICKDGLITAYDLKMEELGDDTDWMIELSNALTTYLTKPVISVSDAVVPVERIDVLQDKKLLENLGDALGTYLNKSPVSVSDAVIPVEQINIQPDDSLKTLGNALETYLTKSPISASDAAVIPMERNEELQDKTLLQTLGGALETYLKKSDVSQNDNPLQTLGGALETYLKKSPVSVSNAVIPMERNEELQDKTLLKTLGDALETYLTKTEVSVSNVDIPMERIEVLQDKKLLQTLGDALGTYLTKSAVSVSHATINDGMKPFVRPDDKPLQPPKPWSDIKSNLLAYIKNIIVDKTAYDYINSNMRATLYGPNKELQYDKYIPNGSSIFTYEGFIDDRLEKKEEDEPLFFFYDVNKYAMKNCLYFDLWRAICGETIQFAINYAFIENYIKQMLEFTTDKVNGLTVDTFTTNGFQKRVKPKIKTECLAVSKTIGVLTQEIPISQDNLFTIYCKCIDICRIIDETDNISLDKRKYELFVKLAYCTQYMQCYDDNKSDNCNMIREPVSKTHHIEILSRELLKFYEKSTGTDMKPKIENRAFGNLGRGSRQGVRDGFVKVGRRSVANAGSQGAAQVGTTGVFSAIMPFSGGDPTTSEDTQDPTIFDDMKQNMDELKTNTKNYLVNYNNIFHIQLKILGELYELLYKEINSTEPPIRTEGITVEMKGDDENQYYIESIIQNITLIKVCLKDIETLLANTDKLKEFIDFKKFIDFKNIYSSSLCAIQWKYYDKKPDIAKMDEISSVVEYLKLYDDMYMYATGPTMLDDIKNRLVKRKSTTDRPQVKDMVVKTTAKLLIAAIDNINN